ncbi:MAG: MoaD/ThiS family protein [Bacillota bacterium]|nr:MoaD/ThiS family protein [Bacillota bacterium]
MIIEISDIFLKDNDSRNKLEIQLNSPKKIIEILEELEIENLGYADFYLNDIKVKKNTEAKNDDKLIVLPIVGGG